MTGPLVREVLPELAAELDRLLREQGRPDLADQLPGLRITAACPCEIEACGSFHTGRPMKRWFRRGKQVPVGEKVVLDTIDGEIVYVEVLDWPGVREALSRFASTPGS